MSGRSMKISIFFQQVVVFASSEMLSAEIWFNTYCKRADLWYDMKSEKESGCERHVFAQYQQDHVADYEAGLSKVAVPNDKLCQVTLPQTGVKVIGQLRV